ncbi:MAG: OmpA family protein [Pseudomonadota bacterium]
MIMRKSLFGAFVGAIFAISGSVASAQDQTATTQATQPQTADGIVSALIPKKPTGGVRSFGRTGTRGISITGDLPAEDDFPSIDLTINFEFDSDQLTNDGWITMQALGRALQDPRLDGMDFRIAGHTDGRGEAGYNEDLSMRRAEAVVNHLTLYYSINPQRLFPIGYGESQLVDPANPDAAINRRVEIINLSPLS